MLEEGIVVADWCEHCGKMEMQKMYFDGGTYWCLWCAKANGDLSEDTIKELKEE